MNLTESIRLEQHGPHATYLVVEDVLSFSPNGRSDYCFPTLPVVRQSILNAYIFRIHALTF